MRMVKKINLSRALSAALFSMLTTIGVYGVETKYIDSVVVIGTKSEHTLGDVPVDTALITKKEIESSNARSVAELLKSVSGFNFTEQSDLMGAMGYKNTVRGLNIESRYLLILVDGQRVFSGFHSGGMAGAGFAHNVNVVPISMIERIEIVKGPGSSLYGSDAISGVMNIITKKAGDKFEAGAGISYGTYKVGGADYLGEKATQKSRMISSANFNVSGPLNEYVKMGLFANKERNNGIHATKYKVNRDYLHLNTRIDASDELKFLLGGEYIKWKEKAKNSGDNMKETSKRFYLQANYAPSEFQDFRLDAFYQNLDADFDYGLYGKMFADVSYKSVNLQHTLTYFENNIITTGAEFIQEDLYNQNIDKAKIKTTSFYMQDEVYFFDDKLVVMPSFRFVHNDKYGNKFVPKLNLAYNVDDDLRFKAQAGKAFKTPLATQTLSKPMNHVAMWVYPNPNLRPETSTSWEVSIEKDMLDDALLFSLAYYDMRLKDQILQHPTRNFIGGVPVFTYKNINKSDIKGIDAALRYEINRDLNLNLSYAYTNAKDKNTNQELIYTPKHTFNASLDYENRPYEFGGMINFNYRSSSLNQVYSPTMSERTQSFSTVGFNVWKKFLKNGKVKFEVSNIFDEELKGSNTIYVGRSAMLSLEYKY